MKFIFAIFALAPLYSFSQEVDASDILFLKIQELEGEIATLRSELESQAYLIEKLLNDNGVYLPDDMILEFQKPNSDRPKIIVYEKKENSNFKVRVVQLQLVMLAGR